MVSLTQQWDIREHSQAHHHALQQLVDAIDYGSLTKPQRLEFLAKELTSVNHFDPTDLDANGKKTFDTFSAIGDIIDRFGPEAIDAFTRAGRTLNNRHTIVKRDI
ncbi:MAG: phosphoenolpyruvate carboxylase [Actinomycetota bacterium]